ncbi:MAG: peroxiredoxin family protein [Akkermansiaceae bacterium]
MFPHERSLVEKWEGRPFAIVGVNSDDKEKHKKLVEDKTVTWRSFNNQQDGFKISDNWNVRGWPTLYIIDHEGVIRHKNLRGEAMEEALEKLIQKAEGK